MSSRYNDSNRDDLEKMLRDIFRRLAALESPSGVALTLTTGQQASVVPSTTVTTPPVLTVSASMQPLFRLYYVKRSNTLKLKLGIACDASTSGSFRVTGISPYAGTIGGTLSVTPAFVGTATLTVDTSAVGSIGDDIVVDVEAQRDAGGVGNVRLYVAQAYG